MEAADEKTCEEVGGVQQDLLSVPVGLHQDGVRGGAEGSRLKGSKMLELTEHRIRDPCGSLPTVQNRCRS